MNNNILIECSQINTNSHVFNNGDFNTRLSKPILINEGDTVQISKTFIDNVSNTDSLVIIEKDIEIVIKNYLYINNNGSSGIIYGSDNIKQDGEDYVYCNSSSLSDPQLAGCVVVNEIKFNAIYSSYSISWGSNDTPLPLTYDDPFGNTHKFFVKIYQEDTNSFKPSSFFDHVRDLVILCKPETLKPDNTGGLWTKFNIDISSPDQYPITGSSAPIHEISLPILRTKSFLFSKGNYSPNDLCDKINNSLGENDIIDKYITLENAIQSPFMDCMLNATTATKPFVGNFVAITGRHVDGSNFRLRTLTGVNYIIGQVINIVITSPSAEFTAALTASGLTLAQMVGTRTIDGFNPSYRQGTESDGMVFYNNGGGQIPVGKPDLNTYGQQSTGTYQITSTILDHDRTKFIRHDGGSYISPAIGSSNFIGTNQIELQYSPDSNKFYFKYIHLPIYDSQGNTIIQFIENTGSGTPTPPNSGKYLFNGKQGGIAFNSLEAYEQGHGQDPLYSYDLWNDKLGFVVSDLCVDYGLVTTTIGAGSFQFPSFNLNEGAKWEDGISTSAARPTLDNMVVKANYVNLQAFSGIKSITDLTTEIEANESKLQTILLNYGYYLIEIQAGFQNEIIGGDSITQNISGIVNRYYSMGTYTSSEGSTFQYIHRGNPQYLQDIKIRILDNEKKLAVGIGDDNTIFLQLIRAPPNPLQIKQEIKTQKEVEKDELEQLNK